MAFHPVGELPSHKIFAPIENFEKKIGQKCFTPVVSKFGEILSFPLKKMKGVSCR